MTLATTLSQTALIAASLAILTLVLVWLFFRQRATFITRELEAKLEAQRLASLQRESGLNDRLLEQSKANELLQQTNVELQTSLTESQQQLSVAQQQAVQLATTEQKYTQLDTDYRRLLQKYHTLEATSATEKKAMQEKLELLTEARQQLNSEFQLLANRIFEENQKRFKEQSQSTLNASVGPLKDQLESFRKRVEDVYDKENAERNRLVGQITELQKQTRQIGEDAINLTNALKGDNKAQGNWGEVILERLLEESGLQKGREYDVQVALKDEHGNRRNPDVVVRLPEGKDIVIDSKVSLLHYEQYASADDTEQRQAMLKQHILSIRGHIQQLSTKSYEHLEGLRSLDFIFLFIPVEAAFMTALQESPGLYQEAYTKQIIIVSPTTLLASLRTVENIWRYEKQNRNAEEIARQAGALHDQFVLLIDALDDIGKYIDKTAEAYSLTRKRLQDGRGNLVTRVDKLRRLGAKTKKSLAQVIDEDTMDELPTPDQKLEETKQT